MSLILLDTKFAEAVLSHDKRMTIRAGDRPYVSGPAQFLLVSDGHHKDGETIDILITKVIKKQFCQLLDTDARAEGFETIEELKQSLLDFYPLLHDGDTLTVVEFECMEGL